MIQPHGNILINRVLPEEMAERAKEEARKLQKIVLNEEEVKEVKNIARGVYSPLSGFLNQEDFTAVVHEMKLSSGITWPIPIILDVDKETADKIQLGEKIALVDEKNNPIALMRVEDKYTYDKEIFAENVFKTRDKVHPGVAQVYAMKEYLLGGEIELLDNSKEPYYHFNLDPKETRLLFKERDWQTVAGFQTRNAPHRAHEYLQRCALEICDGLFINPVIGKKKTGDFLDEMILETYDYLIRNFLPRERAVLSILPLQMRYAGPREAIFHAIVRKNFGCTHFMVGRDHAGVGKYYGPYDAQKIFEGIEDIGLTILRFENSFHCHKCGSLATDKTCPHPEEYRVNPSGTLIRQLIQKGEMVPEEIMRPEISKILIGGKNVFVE